jgi:hypothetical protein
MSKQLFIDYEDQVPPNCSVMEVVPVNEGNGNTQDTILIATYDGSLLAFRMKIKEEGINMAGSSDNIQS